MVKYKTLNLFGGVRGFKIANWQAVHGWDVHVIPIENPEIYKLYWKNTRIKLHVHKKASEIYDKIKTKQITSFLKSYFFIYFMYPKMIADIAKKNKIDVIFAQRHTGAFAAILAKKLFGIGNAKIIFDYQDAWAAENKASKSIFYKGLVDIFYKFEKFLITRSDAVITQGEEQTEMLLKRYNIEPRKFIHTINSADHKIFDTFDTERESLRKKYEIGKGVAVLYSGSVVDYYGVHMIPTAMRNIIKKNRDAQLVMLPVIRDEVYWKKIKDDIKRFGLENNFIEIYPKSKSEIPKIVAACDIGLITHMKGTLIGETSLPSKLFEYMAAGLAIVTSDLPHITKFVIPEKCGIAFEPNNAESLGKAIDKLISDKNLLKEMKKNSRKAVEKKYNWNLEMKKIEDLCIKLK